MLDGGDVDGVFGHEDVERLAEAHAERLEGRPEAKLDALLADASRWFWQRRRGYPSLRERRAALARVATGETPLLDKWRQFRSGAS
jgi:hypothetical protein